MKSPKWKPEMLDDLSGGWLAWESPIGRMIVERALSERGYSAAWSPRDGDVEDDVILVGFSSVDEAKAAAVLFVWEEAKRRLRAADKLRQAMDA